MNHQTGHHGRSSFFTPAARPAAALGYCLAMAGAIGCTRAEVSLGADEAALETGGLCGDGVVVGDVTVADQEAIEALRGCREVTGHLSVYGFPEMDLTPLSELRIVRGGLNLGSTASNNETFVPTLDGLQNLEQVGSLTLANVMVEDLSAFASLRRVEQDPLGPPTLGRALNITGCDRLRDLRGLESLTEFSAVSLTANASLESLTGLNVPPSMRGFGALWSYALKDLSALAPLRELNSLSFQATSIENLDGLQLERVGSVLLSNNDELVQADSLASLQSLGSLTVTDNDRLQTLPDMPEAGGVREVVIFGNAELRAMPAFTLLSGLSITVGSRTQIEGIASTEYTGFELLEVGENPKLESVANIDFPESGSHVAIYGNASLTRIDFGGLTNLTSLQLVANPALSDVWLLHLERVADLEIRDNPQLSMAEFAAVQSFDSEISGNLDAPESSAAP